MLKLYKDLTVSYLLVALVGALTLSVIFADVLPVFVYAVTLVFWIFLCAFVFNRIALKRLNKIINFANNNCQVEETLNRLYGLYNPDSYKKPNAIAAIYIGMILLHYGKYTEAINIVSRFNVELLFKSKGELPLKYMYYHILYVSFSKKGDKVNALDAYNRSNEIINNPKLSQKYKASVIDMHEINSSLLSEDEQQIENALSCLERLLAKTKTLLSSVSIRYSIVFLCNKLNKMQNANEHIDFIIEKGGDTVYRKAALQNDFSPEFLQANDKETYSENPVKEKHFKVLIISVAAVVLMVAAVAAGCILFAKTVYTSDDGNEKHEWVFNKNGELQSWTVKCSYNGSSDTLYESAEDSLKSYRSLAKNKGCKIDFDKTDTSIDFTFTADFNKTDEGFEFYINFPTDEDDFVDEIKYNGDADATYTKRTYRGIFSTSIEIKYDTDVLFEEENL